MLDVFYGRIQTILFYAFILSTGLLICCMNFAFVHNETTSVGVRPWWPIKNMSFIIYLILSDYFCLMEQLTASTEADQIDLLPPIDVI